MKFKNKSLNKEIQICFLQQITYFSGSLSATPTRQCILLGEICMGSQDLAEYQGAW
jgi:hypothetical protein